MGESRLEQSREWSRAEVEAALRDILVDSLGVPEAEVTRSASIVRDLGAESIDFLDIGFKVQQALGVNLQTAEIRTRIMAWGSLILPALGEILQERYRITVSPDDLRALEDGGLVKIVEHLQATQGLAAGSATVDDLAGELVQGLVREFAALGLTVSQADREDMRGIMKADLRPRRLTERTLDLLTVGALVDFICAKLGARLHD